MKLTVSGGLACRWMGRMFGLIDDSALRILPLFAICTGFAESPPLKRVFSLFVCAILLAKGSFPGWMVEGCPS